MDAVAGEAEICLVVDITDAGFSSVCFFNDSLIERRNASMSTFSRTNCFGAAAGVDSGVCSGSSAGVGVDTNTCS